MSSRVIGLRAVILPCVLAIALGVLGCGDTNDQSSSVAQQPATTPPATDVPATTTPTTTPTATAPSTVPGSGESGPGGAGDEEPARTPAAFVVAAGQITPRTVTAAAFLAVDVSVTAHDHAQRVTIDAPGGRTFTVAAGGTRHVLLDGLEPGDYPITTAAGARATLHVVRGGDPGP